MKILARSKDPRGNELITFQFELPTYLLPELLKFKKMEVTWIDIEPYALVRDLAGYKNPKVVSIITLTSSKPALKEFFDNCCPKYEFGDYNKLCNTLFFKSKREWQHKWTELNHNKVVDSHLQQIAEQMYDKYYYSKAVELKEGEWHIPIINNMLKYYFIRCRFN